MILLLGTPIRGGFPVLEETSAQGRILVSDRERIHKQVEHVQIGRDRLKQKYKLEKPSEGNLREGTPSKFYLK